MNNLQPHIVCAAENQNTEGYMKQNSGYCWSLRELQSSGAHLYNKFSCRMVKLKYIINVNILYGFIF